MKCHYEATALYNEYMWRKHFQDQSPNQTIILREFKPDQSEIPSQSCMEEYPCNVSRGGLAGAVNHLWKSRNLSGGLGHHWKQAQKLFCATLFVLANSEQLQCCINNKIIETTICPHYISSTDKKNQRDLHVLTWWDAQDIAMEK